MKSTFNTIPVCALLCGALLTTLPASAAGIGGTAGGGIGAGATTGPAGTSPGTGVNTTGSVTTPAGSVNSNAAANANAAVGPSNTTAAANGSVAGPSVNGGIKGATAGNNVGSLSTTNQASDQTPAGQMAAKAHANAGTAQARANRPFDPQAPNTATVPAQ